MGIHQPTMRLCIRSKTELIGFILLILLLVYATQFYPNGIEDDTVGAEARLNTFIENTRRKDAENVSNLLSLDIGKINETEAKTIFYKTLAFPLQGVCKVLKRIGGVWMDYMHPMILGSTFRWTATSSSAWTRS